MEFIGGPFEMPRRDEEVTLLILVDEARRHDIESQRLRYGCTNVRAANRKWGEVRREVLEQLRQGGDPKQARGLLACKYPFLGILGAGDIEEARQGRIRLIRDKNGSSTNYSSDEVEEGEEEEEAEEEEDEPPQQQQQQQQQQPYLSSAPLFLDARCLEAAAAEAAAEVDTELSSALKLDPAAFFAGMAYAPYSGGSASPDRVSHLFSSLADSSLASSFRSSTSSDPWARDEDEEEEDTDLDFLLALKRRAGEEQQPQEHSVYTLDAVYTSLASIFT